MIDLSGVARHLRLPVEQLRVAADLLQQGYHPAFIERYRADETGCLPRSTLWTLKLEIDRQMRLEAARQKAKDQLPKDAELDEEANKFLARATTEVEIEAALKAFRARRALHQSQERDSQAGQLLEMLISYDGPAVDDIQAWVADKLAIDNNAAGDALQQTSRLVSNLVQCDTLLNEKVRRTIQRKAHVQVAFFENPNDESKSSEKKTAQPKSEAAAAGADSSTPSPKAGDAAEPANESADQQTANTPEANAQVEDKPAGDAAGTDAALNTEPSAEGEVQTTTASLAPAKPPSEQEAGNPAPTGEAPTGEAPASQENSVESSAAETPTAETPTAETPTAETPTAETPAAETSVGETSAESGVATSTGAAEAASENPSAPAESAAEEHSGEEHAAEDHDEHHDELHEEHEESAVEAKGKTKAGKSKKPAKMTPRQRRRRWLIAMLQPMKTLKRPLTKLTAYQQLMLGRGRRSQLVKTDLDYDVRSLVPIARDSFVTDKHPLSKWFSSAVEQALEHSLRAKIEADAIADLEELAQEKLLETAADQLRQHLMRRPVRGHTIMLVDTVGPKAASVAVVGPHGDVLGTEELPCSAQPEIVNQNVVKLGELAHKHRVTLVALTNGPARRFLVLTIRELMKQSAESGLRWTMADRGGAEAYAAGRTALKELSAHNRRDRAAIWIARCLQNPLAELLKVDINRMRLGSYQRELPQEPLKKLVREVISDCVCSRGIDTHHAAVNELLFVPGVEESQATQIVALTSEGKLSSRSQLCESVSDWPETQARQAIGWLRVFGSEQTLDATAIHPEDYRLAHRLIDNTEFDAPPAAPEGWSMPTPAAKEEPPVSEAATDEPAKAASEGKAADETAADSASADGAAPVEARAGAPSEEQAPTEESSAEAAPSAAEPVAEATTSTDEAAPEPSPEAASPESPASETASESAPEAAADDAAPAEDATSASTSDAAPLSFKSEAPAESATVASGPAPEYPEDIATASATAGPDIDVEKLARGWQVGREKLKWIAECLRAPFADSRLDGTPIPLSREMPTLSSLEPGQCVWAVVVGVADFGAFVELSPDCSGLIHISRLSANYVEDPHQCVQVGDLLMTWVVSTDEKKNRVALTALSPAERAQAEAASQQRRDQRHSGSGGKGGGRQGGQPRGDRQQAGSDQRPRGQGSRGQGQGRGQGQSGDRGRGGRSGGGRGGSQDRSRGRGGPRPAKTVVVTSKKPKAPISAAMKEGEEPLRSFSDLLQFYEAKRTDEPATPAAKAPTKTPAPAENTPKDQAAEANVPEPASSEPPTEQNAAPATDPSPQQADES